MLTSKRATAGSSDQPTQHLFGIAPDHAVLLIAIVLVAKVVLLFAFALNTRFVMDEFVQFGWAKYFPEDFFKTIWPGKAVGYAVFYKPAHLLGWDARSTLLGGRLQTALLACATLAMVYATARTMGRTRFQALTILVVLLSFSNFIERIFRTIAEPPAVFLAAAALLVAIRGYRSSAQIVVAGALCGFSFLTTQKAVYFDVALGLGLVGDAFIARQYREGIIRGVWLVAGWLIAIAIYCFGFGGMSPLPILSNLVVGPAAVLDPSVPAAYGGLRNYVAQTLVRNAIIYLFCFSGMLIALMRLRTLNTPSRISLIFSLVITALIFTHDQPWPYVFVMCLPFMALWALEPFDLTEASPIIVPVSTMVLAVGVGGSFVRNVAYLQLHNRDQLELVDRAEGMLERNDTYFDGVAMLPNRREPSALWLDRVSILRTVHDGKNSEAYAIFAKTPPKLILWNYRLDGISSVIRPFLQNSYVKVAPNVRVAGRDLQPGRPATFDVPVAGVYELYDGKGRPLNGRIKVNGMTYEAPIRLERGSKTVLLETGATEAKLLPKGNYVGVFSQGADNPDLFAGVYS